MITQLRSSESWSDTLKARKANLASLLKNIDIKTGKTTTLQTLTVNLIKDELVTWKAI
ncbi:hypothetical protein [Pseudomonas sp. R45(2017)]|uniref:hypothetical protein n=1 Tax=Pseudomonas sp. R45(2017) TaxID=1981678 RepID=UPI0015944B4B|nr:hypothetical protein [Pseudomonas sp. R45(2017)]